MASVRTVTFIGLMLLAILGGATARKDPDYSPPKYEEPKDKEYYSPPPPKYEEPKDKEYYSPPPPKYEEPKDKEYYSPPPPKYEEPKDKEYYSPPPPKYDDDEYPEYSDCEEYADNCDFKFLNSGIPTFHLIERSDNAYGPIIVDKYNYPTKVLNPNGECQVLEDDKENDDHYRYDDDCKDNFYFRHNRVATRTFNIRPVKEFRGKCIRLDITSAQLWDHTNLNPNDGNKKYPEDRRCVVFRTA